MPCFFCKNIQLNSQKCNICIENNSKKEILPIQDRCDKCLGILIENDGNKLWCTYCAVQGKCYSRFSKNHFTEDCPNRFQVSPNIDYDLLKRFVQLLTFEEKYSLFFTFPLFYNLMKLKPIKVISRNEVSFSNLKTYSAPDIFVANKLLIKEDSDDDFFFYDDDESFDTDYYDWFKFSIFRVQHLEVYYTCFARKKFLRLLSPKTKFLKCGTLDFYPSQSKKAINSESYFSKILQKAPNLENIFLQHTNLETGNSWPSDLLQLINRDVKLNQIHLPVNPDLNFDVESLVTLMKKVSCSVFIYLIVSPLYPKIEKEAFDTITSKLLQYFVLVEEQNKQSLIVSSAYQRKHIRTHGPIVFALKSV